MKKLVTRFLLRTQGTRATFPPYPGGSSSASNHRASRPTAAARAVSVACYAAAGLLVALAALLALPLPAQAQSKILVSNLEQSAVAPAQCFQRSRRGASIHHGQQQRRLHAEKVSNSG